MPYKRILTIQDISCLGQCSTTVALPILSACGHETCILPSAVLSTHTGGFKDVAIRDLTEDLPRIENHWCREGIAFDAIYTGYLGSIRQIDYVKHIFGSALGPGGKIAVDPAMADHGKLYTGFSMEYVEAMKGLCWLADVILPNITEACLLTGLPYRERYDPSYISDLVRGLRDIGAKTVVLTGVSYREDTTGVLVADGVDTRYLSHKRIPRSYHGTGDIFSSAFVGAWMQGNTLYDAAGIAARYTVSCIANTVGDQSHWYGVKFETALGELIEALKTQS